jgi:hypothetical protein
LEIVSPVERPLFCLHLHTAGGETLVFSHYSTDRGESPASIVGRQALALILASYGFPASTTLAPIIVYRVVSYWLPAGLSFLAGGSTFLKSPEAKAVADSN